VAACRDAARDWRRHRPVSMPGNRFEDPIRIAAAALAADRAAIRNRLRLIPADALSMRQHMAGMG